jgi:hypothetical protein
MRFLKTLAVVAALLSLMLFAGPASAAAERIDVNDFNYLNCGTGNPRYAVTIDGSTLVTHNGREVWHLTYAFLNVGGGSNSPATGETFTDRYNGARPDDALSWFPWSIINEACGF